MRTLFTVAETPLLTPFFEAVIIIYQKHICLLAWVKECMQHGKQKTATRRWYGMIDTTSAGCLVSRAKQSLWGHPRRGGASCLKR